MIVWIDTETTGLSARHERLLEVAAIATNDDLVEVARYQAVTDQARGLDFTKVDPYVLEMHCKNGLWGESIARGKPLGDVTTTLANFILCHSVIVPAQLATPEHPATVERVIAPPLGGSTVSFDREFLKEHCPAAAKLLHYHHIDITSFNEMAKRAWPSVYAARPRQLEGTPAARWPTSRPASRSRDTTGACSRS